VTLTPGSKDGGKDVILECEVAAKQATSYVEIKNWRSSIRVGADAVEKLLKVIDREKEAGGLFFSTYRFTENAFEQLTTIDRQKLRFGDQDRIVTLCRTYVKAKAGIWSHPPRNLTEVIFDD
jgi:restriction system protein